MTETVKNVPSPIVSSDDDMEEPVTKDYSKSQTESETQDTKVGIFIKQEFKDALLSTIGNLGYDRVIGTPEHNLKISQIFEIIDSVLGKPLSEQQANQLVDMISKAPYNVIYKVMDNIKKNQSIYFDVKKIQ